MKKIKSKSSTQKFELNDIWLSNLTLESNKLGVLSDLIRESHKLGVWSDLTMESNNSYYSPLSSLTKHPVITLHGQV
jgi:hypothetical protein